MNNTHFYHYATKGFEDDILFGSTKAFIAGINRIAFCVLKCRESSPVLVFAFCLMDNHVHFILYGTEEACDQFMSMYIKLTGIWLSNHPDEGHARKDWDVGHWIINNRESLIEKINYVHRNPCAAFMPFVPGGYRWSSANLLFSDNSFILSICNMASDFSANRKKLMFETKVSIPDDWMILPDGMIWPGNYMEYRKVQKLFSSIFEYQYELNRHCEDKVNMEMLTDSVSLPDSEVRDKAKSIGVRLFGTDKISTLGLEQRILVAKELRKEMGSSSKQIARIVRIKISDLRQLL